MSEGIKLLCISKQEVDAPSCFHSVIIPAKQFLSFANKEYKCPKCGHKSKAFKKFFAGLLSLQKATNDFQETDFYVDTYGLAFESCYKDDFDTISYVLEHNDWGFWNMQISSIYVAKIE